MDEYNEAFFRTGESSDLNEVQPGSEAAPSSDILQEFDFNAYLDEGDLKWDITNSYEESYLSRIDFAPKIDYEQEFAEPPPAQVEELVVSVIDKEAPAPEAQVAIADEAVSTQARPNFVSVSGQQTPYRNAMLNDFNDPEVPLRIIDQLNYPFSQEIQAALAQALTPQGQEALNQIDQALEAEHMRREQVVKKRHRVLISNPIQENLPQDRDMGQRDCERDLEFGFSLATALQNEAQDCDFLGVPQQTPVSLLSGASTPGRKTPKNSRARNIAEKDPARFYKSLPECPTSWIGKDPKSRQVLFEYTNHGELTPMRQLSGAEMCAYLSDHPLHTVNGQKNSRESRLTVWIQSTPADSALRYPTVYSSKCRFDNCPDKHHTIRNGEYRLAFDEQHWKNESYTPFHNAAYVHLYCMEKNFNFPQFCKDFNVRPDCRQIPEGINKMAITRDHQSMKQVCLNFIKYAPPSAPRRGDISHDWFENSLTRQLTVEHTKSQSSHVQKQRLARGGIHMEVHWGNLDKLVNLKTNLKQQKAAGIMREPNLASAPRLQRKRKSDDERTEESGLDDNILERDSMPRLSKKLRY